MKVVFQDPLFSFQTLRVIGSSYYGGADIGECLSTANRIKEGDFESWYTEWLKTANRIQKYAEECNSSKHTVSACQAYLRASSYYRTAEFFLHENPNDSRLLETWQASVDTFLKAAGLFTHHFQEIEIPYEGTTIPGYFYKPSKEVGKNDVQRPTFIIHTGFDGTQEELYSQSVLAALQRGYNCLTFEGPGQGRVIRKQKIPFRYDWEKVVTPVIDYALDNLEGIYPNKIALMGISLGGYLAARAAAFEPRLSACVLNDGVYDLSESFVGKFRKTPLESIMTSTNADLINAAVSVTMAMNSSARWGYTHGMWAFGVTTPFEIIQKTLDYNLKGIAEKIKCPTLVMEAERDESFPGQPEMVYDSLIGCSTKKFLKFTEEEGAEDHCHVGALSLANQRIIDWLDDTTTK
ncbi:MAG: alpha/beta hydrolase family protein [Nitrososphaeraceae archaeon]